LDYDFSTAFYSLLFLGYLESSDLVELFFFKETFSSSESD